MAPSKIFYQFAPTDSDKAYAFGYGLGAAIGAAVLSHLLALLIFGIGRFLGFLEDKAGVIEVGTPNNKAPEQATENPIAVDERFSPPKSEEESKTDSSDFFWGLIRYISFIVVFIFLNGFSIVGIEGSSKDPDWGVGTPKWVWWLLLVNVWGIIDNIYRLLAHVIRWLRSL